MNMEENLSVDEMYNLACSVERWINIGHRGVGGFTSDKINYVVINPLNDKRGEYHIRVSRGILILGSETINSRLVARAYDIAQQQIAERKARAEANVIANIRRGKFKLVQGEK